MTAGPEMGRLALGTAQWGMPYGVANRGGQPDAAEVRRMLDVAAEAGVQTLDTARAYGRSEEVIGAVVGGRGRWRVVTKLDPAVHAPGMGWAETAPRVRESIERSRAALRADRLDTLLLHVPAHRRALGGSIWDLLRERCQAGEIGRLGISATSVADAWDAVGDHEVETVQVPASLFDQRLLRGGFFTAAAQRGKEVFGRSLFLQGVAHLEPASLPAPLGPLAGPLVSIRAWGERHGLAVGDVFLAFMRESVDASVVVGCESVAQLEENLRGWAHARLPPSDRDELAALVPDLGDAVLDPWHWWRSVPDRREPGWPT